MAENFDGQASCDMAIKFGTTYQGLPEWSLAEDVRYSMKHIAIYDWSADEGDLVMVSDWLPIIIE